MRFRDRLDAADRLAARLTPWHGPAPLVLAVPRGAVGMAQRVAQALKGDFDVVLVRKLRAPGCPEVAVGAIAEDGWTWIAPWAGLYGADPAYLQSEKAEQTGLIRARQARYAALRTPQPIAGRTVIVIDDGAATGATLVAALNAVRAQAPARLICAVPVASSEALSRLKPLCDELLCLNANTDFGAVGAYYDRFDQVDDTEVEAALSSPPARSRPPDGTPSPARPPSGVR